MHAASFPSHVTYTREEKQNEHTHARTRTRIASTCIHFYCHVRYSQVSRCMIMCPWSAHAYARRRRRRSRRLLAAAPHARLGPPALPLASSAQQRRKSRQCHNASVQAANLHISTKFKPTLPFDHVPTPLAGKLPLFPSHGVVLNMKILNTAKHKYDLALFLPPSPLHRPLPATAS